MKRTFVLKIEKTPLDGSIAIRCEETLEQFYEASAAILQTNPAALIRPALREHRRKVLRANPGLKTQLKRLSPQLLNGL